MKKRRIEPNIENFIKHDNAIVLTGARRVGKTSLLKNIFRKIESESKLWFDLDNPLHQKIFEGLDYNDVYKELIDMGLHPKQRKYVFIDEVQNFPEITKVIKYLIDHYKIKFFLTGSSSFYLRNLFPESLAGRKFEFNLYPLDFGEFLYFKGLVKEIPDLKIDFKNITEIRYEKFDQEYTEFIRYGSFPQVVLAESTEEKKLLLADIFKSFFQIDILKLSQYQDVKEIRELIILLTRRIGSKLDISKLASELGVQRAKVYSYLEFLQATFMINLVSQYSKSVDKSIAAGKKIYFVDTGLASYINQIGEGELFENAVFNSLSRHGTLNYYTDKTQEIDFILNKEYAFEVKLTGTKTYYDKLLKTATKLGLEKSFLISKSFVKDKSVPVVYPQGL